MGFALGLMRLMFAFEVRRAKVPGPTLLAALNPSYRRAAGLASMIEEVTS